MVLAVKDMWSPFLKHGQRLPRLWDGFTTESTALRKYEQPAGTCIHKPIYNTSPTDGYIDATCGRSHRARGPHSHGVCWSYPWVLWRKSRKFYVLMAYPTAIKWMDYIHLLVWVELQKTSYWKIWTLWCHLNIRCSEIWHGKLHTKYLLVIASDEWEWGWRGAWRDVTKEASFSLVLV